MIAMKHSPFFFIFAPVLLLSSLLLPALAAAQNTNQSTTQTISQPPDVAAKAWILLDYTSGTELAQHEADTRFDPASLTKIMTSYVIGQALKSGKIHATDTVTIGKNAWATGNPQLRGSSLMFLKPGDQVSVADLNRGIIIQSGNDASIAMADYVAGSQESFINLMNSYAQRLAMNNTHFATVHGLDAPGQYTSARDMALLTQALIRDDPNEYAINKEKSFTFNNITQPNRNRLLWSKSLQVDGVKTGTTSRAGYNLVVSATQGDMRLIAVILGSKTDAIRFREAEKLLTWGFRFYETVSPASASISTQRVWYGEPKQVQLGVGGNSALTIPRSQAQGLSFSYTLSQTDLLAPLSKGQQVGTVNFLLNGNVIAQRPLVTLEAVQESGFFSRIWDYILLKLHHWFG